MKRGTMVVVETTARSPDETTLDKCRLAVDAILAWVRSGRLKGFALEPAKIRIRRRACGID